MIRKSILDIISPNPEENVNFSSIGIAAAEQTHPAYGNGQVSSGGGNMTVTHGTSPLTPEINMLVTAERTIFQ
ncbi:hypothetical protein Anas_12159, partial [Armadillidium nasatum]